MGLASNLHSQYSTLVNLNSILNNIFNSKAISIGISIGIGIGIGIEPPQPILNVGQLEVNSHQRNQILIRTWLASASASNLHSPYSTPSNSKNKNSMAFSKSKKARTIQWLLNESIKLDN